jgi:hypothetical protein
VTARKVKPPPPLPPSGSNEERAWTTYHAALTAGYLAGARGATGINHALVAESADRMLAQWRKRWAP